MSQWNNSYAYNNQYQGANTWNSEMNGQYANQGFYPNPNNQYVSFTEFLSQMQGNNEAASNNTNYNNMQYQNYPHNQQYNYQEVPSSSQNAQMQSYAYNSNPNNTNTEDSTAPVNPIPKKAITSDIVINSNLTPTAIEFVPKSSNVVMSSNIDAQPESSTSYKPTKESRSVHGSSSDKNWRERPQSSHDSSRPSDSFKQNESNRNDSSTYKNYDSNSYNRESNNKNRNRDRKNDNRNYSTENSGHSNGSQSNYDSSNRQTDNGRNYGSSRRNYDNNQDDSNGQYESSNYDSNGRNYESSSRYNENRGLFKGKGKKDSDRTFYNSAINKNQDVRNGRGEGPNKKNWIGSQRLRAADRNSVEDEQYASSYLQGREDRERTVKSENLPSPRRNKSAGDQKGTVNKEMTQRERLTEQLNKGTLECLVCCERVKQTDSVWSCANCYHVLHLRCIKKWATSSVVEGKWRCPACQNTSEQIPSEYWCLCGAVRSPEWARGAAGAHSCGRGCRRARTCTHACPLPCHPGPCPPCQAMVTKECGCGVEKRQMMCSNKQPLECGRACARELLCGRHQCEQPCHPPPCEPCTHTVTQECACKTPQSRTVPCTAESNGTGWFACGGPCARVLSCGVHACSRTCHSGDCEPCKLMPEYVTTCPCGKNRLDQDKRKACTDPIPVCGNICAKPLSCGPAGDKHFCKIDCHEGACPVCPDSTLMQCRCGHSSREVPCADLPDVGAYVLCQKKCNKKLSCGRHRCRAVCCAAERSGQHRCGVVCGRALSCQLHRCEEFCHTGHCAPCPRLSFEELRCSCGAEVVYPPVRCGARPPACSAECTRARPCGHAAHHACHAGDCPPCVVLTTKMCHGRHEERKTIPCSQDEFSCGLPCGKPLSCGKHSCIKTCHKGPCDSSKCAQPCTAPRTVCGHWCAAACHAGAGSGTPCPASAPCRRLVTASCQCGRRKLERSCADNAKDLAKLMAALTASRVQEGGAVDLSDVQRPGAMLKTLECDDTCRAEARSRQLALALQIRNPDVQAKLAPRYGESLRALAVREPSFAHNAHEKLTELVQRAKKSKQKTRSYSFPSMNWQKRQFIHELCEHFGCESVAYDAEPNRNVVATADREKSWLPAMSVLEVVSREAGKRRVPGPVLRAPPTAQPSASTAGAAKPSSGWATLTSTNAWAARSQARAPAAPAAPSASATATLATAAPPDPPKIDYFDNPPE